MFGKKKTKSEQPITPEELSKLNDTFAVTDKVYDRAMPINIDNKGVAFEAPDTPPVVINYKHFEEILDKAKADNPVSEDTLKKLALVDDYIMVLGRWYKRSGQTLSHHQGS